MSQVRTMAIRGGMKPQIVEAIKTELLNRGWTIRNLISEGCFTGVGTGLDFIERLLVTGDLVAEDITGLSRAFGTDELYWRDLLSINFNSSDPELSCEVDDYKELIRDLLEYSWAMISEIGDAYKDLHQRAVWLGINPVIENDGANERF